MHSNEALGTKTTRKLTAPHFGGAMVGCPEGINSSHKHYVRDVTPAMEPFRKMQSAFKDM